MNTKGIAKHYDTLGPWERVPLICAASVQGDDLERERLARSAPTLTFRVPHHYGLSDGLRSLAAVHMMMGLDLAALFWKAQSTLTDAKVLRLDSARERLEEGVRMLAFKIVRLSTVWRTFFGQLRIDGDRLLNYLPGYETLVKAEEEATPLAFTDAEALAFLQKLGGEGMRLPPIQEEVNAMREYLDSHLTEWS